MRGGSMHEAEHDLKAILYPSYVHIIDCAWSEEVKST